MFFCSVCVPSRSATSWAAQGLEAVRWPCTWSRFGATGQPCLRVDNAPSLFVFLLSLPGKAGIKREGSYFSGRLQAPSFPSPSTLRAKSWQFKVVVALSWCAEEAGRFWPQGGSFCSPLAAFTGEAWSIGCSIKARLWTLGRGSADSRAHYWLLVSGSARPKVHFSGYWIFH